MEAIEKGSATQQFIVLYLALPPKRKDRVNRLLVLLREADDPAHQREIAAAVEEIISTNRRGQLDPVDMGLGISDSVKNKMDGYRKHIGKCIRDRRVELGMTQEQLGDKAGLPQSHICRLEIGQHTPTSITIEKIATALGVEPSAIDLLYE